MTKLTKCVFWVVMLFPGGVWVFLPSANLRRLYSLSTIFQSPWAAVKLEGDEHIPDSLVKSEDKIFHNVHFSGLAIFDLAWYHPLCSKFWFWTLSVKKDHLVMASDIPIAKNTQTNHEITTPPHRRSTPIDMAEIMESLAWLTETLISEWPAQELV